MYMRLAPDRVPAQVLLYPAKGAGRTLRHGVKRLIDETLGPFYRVLADVRYVGQKECRLQGGTQTRFELLVTDEELDRIQKTLNLSPLGEMVEVYRWG